MLTSEGIALFCQRLGLSSQAQAVLATIRSSPPSRRVGGGGKSVPVRYPNRKMSVIIQATSLIVEFAGVYLMEHVKLWSNGDRSPAVGVRSPVSM